jgi:beta-phosphoglucomutase-like phosphatase (HAD superfamily)
VSPFELIIFDCDGVLVDSGRLAVRTETQILSSLGWPLSEKEVIDRFVGRSAEYLHEQIQQHLGRPVDWEQEFESRYREVFEHGPTSLGTSRRAAPHTTHASNLSRKFI